MNKVERQLEAHRQKKAKCMKKTVTAEPANSRTYAKLMDVN